MSSPNLLAQKQVGRFTTNRKKNYGHKLVNSQTQTSKTILQLADLELKNAMRNNEIPQTSNQEVSIKDSNLITTDQIGDVTYERKNNILQSICHKNVNSMETNRYNELCRADSSKIEKTHITFVVEDKPDFSEPKSIAKNSQQVFSPSKWSRFNVREVRIKSFNADNMKLKNTNEIQDHYLNAEDLDISQDSINSIDISPTSTGNSKPISPTSQPASEDLFSYPETVTLKSIESGKYRDKLHLLLSQVKSGNWDVSLKAMLEIANSTEEFEYERLYSNMAEINQRLIELLRSPRSHVARISCQIAGKFFETVKDTRRPEFDEIVDSLLSRTADSNKFIRNDANVALDSLIMHIPPFHALRAISQRAPTHKNDLIRITCARLMVCIVGLAGPSLFLNPPGNESSRKRLLLYMVKFIKDKNIQAREFGVRLYNDLQKHPHFETYLKKLVNKSSIIDIHKILKHVTYQ